MSDTAQDEGGVSPDVVRAWLDRWDRQQNRYVVRREERFEVIASAVETIAGAAPVVVDLGCGPGSLGARLLDRLPDARVEGVDSDPLLMTLGRAAYPALTFVDADLAGPDWVAAIGLAAGGVDAVVSTTALHWLDPGPLSQLFSSVAGLLRPGGIFLDGDHLGLPGDRPGLMSIVDRLREADRAVDTSGELWDQWWDAVVTEPSLASAVAERESRHPVEHSRQVRRQPSYDDYVEALQRAGFTEIADLWRRGDDVVLAALR